MTLQKLCKNCRSSSKKLDFPESINVVLLCEDKIISNIYKDRKSYCFLLNKKNDCERYKSKRRWFGE